MGERQTAVRARSADAEERVNGADYVEARGLLIPATEYLQRAVDTARIQGNITGTLLCTVHLLYPVLKDNLLNKCRLRRHI